MTGVGMAGQKMTDISLLFVSVLSSCSLSRSKKNDPSVVSVSVSIRFIFEMFFCLTWLRWYK